MNEYLPFIIVGLAAGSVYGLAAVGLVLTYRTSGIFNFAHGALAAVGAFAFYELHFERGLPWPVAALICLVVVAGLLGLALERMAAVLAQVRPALQIVATLGVLLLVQGLATGLYGAESKFVSPFLPDRTVPFLGVRVGVDQIIVFVLATAGSLGLAWLLQKSRLGAAMRAVVDDPDLMDATGWSPTTVRRWSWLIGATFAVVSGILIFPTLSLDAVLLTLLVVQAFGAAAIGRFSSLPLTYAGGLAIGVASSLLTKEFSTFKSAAVQGLVPSLPFLVLFALLVLIPRRLPTIGLERLARSEHGEGQPLPPWTRLPVLAGLVIATIVIPHVAGTRLPVFISGAALISVFVSMVVLINLSGQVSLCHAAFAALGATTFAHLTTGAGLPWLVGLVMSGVVTIPLGALVAIPAIRLSGLYLALATFGLGILLQKMLYFTGFMFGPLGTRVAPRPDVFGFTSDTRFFYLTVAFGVLSCVAAIVLCRSRLGRILRAMADSPRALAGFGLSVNVTRVLVFCLSAAVAGQSGALLAAGVGSANAVAFGPLTSLLWLAALTIGGRGVVKPAILAAVGVAVVPTYFPGLFGEWGPAIFGSAALAVVLGSSGRFDLNTRLARAADAARWRISSGPVTARLRPEEVVS